MFRGAFPPITTRQAFRFPIEIFSDLDDTPFDLTGAKVQVSIGTRWPDTWWVRNTNRINYYDGSLSDAPILTASTDDGTISNPATGVYIANFTPSQIATLLPGQYVVGINIKRGDFSVQLALGELPVLDGVVPQ